MSNKVKVTVILTSYNHAKYLHEAIDSVLNQTFTNFEMIIVDDASTDESWQIIEGYTDPRIRTIRNDINQVGRLINKVISEMETGEYIAIHHSDDVWQPDKLEKQVSFLDTNSHIGAVFSRALIIGEDSDVFSDQSHPYQTVFEQPNLTRFEWLNYFFYNGNALCHPSVLIRKKCYEEVGLYRYGLAQLPDFDMWVRLCLKYEIHVLPEKLVRFRVRDNEANSSGDSPEKQIRFQFEYLQVYSNYLSITNRKEFLSIFPDSACFFEKEEFDIHFSLAMTAISSSYPFGKLFGLQLLFNIINDSEHAKKVERIYGFTSMDFVELTTRYDIFSVVMNRHLQIGSKLWNFILLLRKIRAGLFPKGSFREKMLDLIYHLMEIWHRDGVRILLQRIKKRLTAPIIYLNWIRKNEPDKKRLTVQRETNHKFLYQPLISIITPVFNTPLYILEATIKSVIDQTYENWELCIANGSPESLEICHLLKKYAEMDHRIKITTLPFNQGIAGNTNAAIAISQGDFVAFLDHDDCLSSFALFEVVLALQQYSGVDLIYSDEDLISENGRERFSPHFKPSFSLDLLRSINYINHFLVIRKKMGDKLGWLRDGYEGAQDYDLVLRSIEQSRDIVHIPKVLYHWRYWSSSTTNKPATSTFAKKLAHTNGKKALQEHLERCRIDGFVGDGPEFTTYQVKYKFTNSPLISIIILNRDNAEYLQKCVLSIRNKSTYNNYEIIIVENASQERETFRLYDELIKDSFVRIVEYKGIFSFSQANNFAARQALGDVILFLNNDTEVISCDWLKRMLEHTLRREVGVVGSKLYYLDNTIQHAGVILGIGGFAGHSHKYFHGHATGYINRLKLIQNYSAVTGACFMIRKHVFYDLGGFDEQYDLALGDVDLCLKAISKGYLIVWTPYAELYHYESRTRGYEDTREKQKRFKNEIVKFRKNWLTVIKNGDDYYNPNLSLDVEDFSVNSNIVNALVRIKPGFANPGFKKN